MTNRLTITNAGQNSGSALILLGAQMGYSWGNLTKDFPHPGIYNGVTEVEYKGWKNPSFNIRFYIELTNPTAGCITWTQFNMIVRDTINKNYLNLTFGENDTAFSSFASVPSTTSTGVASIPIQVIDYNVLIDPNVTDKLYITMNCMETI